MATVSDVTVEETAASADDVFQDADPQPDHAHGSVELTAYRINDGERQMVSESSVSFIIKDETSSNWQTSRFNRVLPFSTSIDSLYTLVANDAGYIPGSFNLVWRNQGSGVEEELLLEQHSTATLFEMNMPEEPNKTYLLIKEKNGKEPIKAMKEDKEHSTGQSSNWSSSSQSTNWSASNSGWVSYTNPSYNSSSYSSTNYSVGNYGYGSYSYNSRSDTGHVGLVNQAMTCYLNSLLQTLYMTPEFRNSIYQWKFESKAEDDGMAAKEELARIEASKCIPYQLQRLFLQLQTVRKRAVETTDVTTSFGWDSSEAWQQHDVQELCRVMFDALEKRFKKDQQHQEKTKGDMINELYQGKCKDYVKCKKCGHESARVDTFLDIPLVIKPFGRTEPVGSVEEAIKAFVEPETLEGDNQYFCEKCNEKQDALKGLKFKQFPYLLTLQLKRFDFDYQTLHRIKLNDRMTFPKVLNLNEFIDGDESKPEVPNDVEAKYSDFIVEKFDRTGQPPSYASVISSSSQNFVDGAEEEAVATQDKKSYIIDSFKEGPYVYELFSIMIHSGSAMGGHYYAYIKSFEDKRWYCFNDQSVTRITQEEIEQTFGGMDRNSSRGYYSSMYSYSANAYMLMYRRIDKVNNQVFLTDKEFPDHLKQQIEEEKEREQNERKKQEMEKQMCRFKLFCNHPETGNIVESKLEIHQNTPLPEAVTEAHKVLKLAPFIPVERCRLVKYDDYSETMDQSFDIEEFADQTFGQLVGGARTYYSFELFLETRKEDEKFVKYNKGGMKLKLQALDLTTGEFSSPVSIRAEQPWTVAELKEVVGDVLEMDHTCMNLVMEVYNDGRFLANDATTLRGEGLYRKHTLFVSSDPVDYQKPYKESLMYKCVESYVNSILLHITLPPRVEPHQPEEVVHSDVDDSTPPINNEQEDDKKLIDNNKNDNVDNADNGGAGPEKGKDSDEEEVKSKLPKKDIKIISEEEKGKKRELQIRIDRRTTLSQLKTKLSSSIGAPPNGFKVYRVYNNQQEYEMERLNDSLMSIPSESKFVIRLGRALQIGEHRIKLFLLDINKTEFFNLMMESIVAKNTPIRDFKEDVIKEAKIQGVNCDLELDKMRLRKKTWRSPGTIYLDHQLIDKDVYVYAGSEMYVEPLEGLETMKKPTQMQVYVRRWCPAEFKVEPTKEIILDTANISELRQKLSEHSGIPIENLSVAKAVGSFPCEVSLFEIESELDWNPPISSINQNPFSLYDDGGILYYKDLTETIKVLTEDEKSEIQKSENTRFSKSNVYSGTGSSYSNYSYYRKEKALKIYTEDDTPKKDE